MHFSIFNFYFDFEINSHCLIVIIMSDIYVDFN